MKKLWLFGGSKKEFAQTVTQEFDVTSFGRHNLDYSDVDSFIQNITDIPDIIVFNIANNGFQINQTKKYTSKEEISNFTNIVNTTFYFQLRVTEWFFQNYENKRILWLTSLEPYHLKFHEENKEGDLIIYRMSRAIEHQAIYMQNVLHHNINKKNIIMGICVGANVKGTDSFINYVLKNDILKRGVYGFSHETLTDGITYTPQLESIKIY